MQTDQLEALAAIVDHGTFDAAARHLRLTPSAVSQRIRSLETGLGQLMVRRTVPCTPTPAGEIVLRLARQVLSLYADARAELTDGEFSGGELPVAVNADSLSTWFTDVLTSAAGWRDCALRLRVEDQDHTAALLRAGEVVAAITSDPTPVIGCRTEPLGRMRYLAVATPELREAYRSGRGPDWRRMPVVTFNTKDDLQSRLLPATVRAAGPDIVHEVPSSEGFLAAVRAGLGWGAVPVDQLGDDVETGRLVRLGARAYVDVTLSWQVWRLASRGVDRLTAAVRAAAASRLRT